MLVMMRLKEKWLFSSHFYIMNYFDWFIFVGLILFVGRMMYKAGEKNKTEEANKTIQENNQRMYLKGANDTLNICSNLMKENVAKLDKTCVFKMKENKIYIEKR